LDDDGKARGPVNIVNEDPDASVAIAKDGKQYAMVLSYVLTQSGKYVVTVTDKAGNSNEYQFIIMIYLDSYGVILLIIFILIVIAVGVYIYYTRTHLKTR
jgi:formate hydrogenlyase subunit 3/multisubunit Na+/H+ antiporter MnhD subunit